MYITFSSRLAFVLDFQSITFRFSVALPSEKVCGSSQACEEGSKLYVWQV
jgi:hypothetical protein